MRHSALAVLAASTVMLTAACALAYNAPSTSLQGVESGTYVIDDSHTSVNFGISHMGFSNYQGRFDKVSGSLSFDAKEPEKSGLTVTVLADSIDTNNAKLEGELKGAQWFDSAKYPTLTFVSTGIQKLSETTGKVTGNLTMHGVTKPVTLDVTFNGGGANPLANVAELGFSAKGSIKRSEFGISQYIPMVGDDVAISIETEMHLKK
jgi:polyisoprenoid-binding protein YceI